MESLILKASAKAVGGRLLYYPENETAKVFRELLRRKTAFSEDDLKNLQKLIQN